MRHLPRLSPEAIVHLPEGISRPAYLREDQKPGILHFGTGAFHRAHQAVYADTLMNAGERDWRILGVSMRSGAVPDLLNPQKGLYTVVENDGIGQSARLIGALDHVFQAGPETDQIIRTLASPEISLVTITVTEKGYCLQPATGELDISHPLIARDIANPDAPVTLPGLLVAGLAEREATGLAPLTLLSCDNLAHNGKATQRAVLDFAAATNPSLARWIEAECTFPSSMVDRIVPATTPDNVEDLTKLTGIRDPAMVKTEPFSQWVIEDRFAARRPPFKMAGALFTDNVTGWETTKLRMLNGAHSAMAYLGALAGFEFIHEAIAFVPLRAFVDRLWDEQEATLPSFAGFDTKSYRQDLLARFRNPALNHRTRQIAMDGSQKLPQRLIAPLRARRAMGLPCENQCLAIAAWMRWQLGRDETGTSYKVDDPLAAESHAALQRSRGDAASMTVALLSLEAVFGTGLGEDTHIVHEVTRSFDALLKQGAKETLSQRG